MKIKKAVIPAAGLGTRMLPATKTIPKEMLAIVDKPAIQYIIEEAVMSGIEDILIITNRSKSAMDDYFDYHPELEERLSRSGKTDDINKIRAPAEMANIFYVRQKETKGLGHAIWTAKNFIGNESFAVLLGDDIMSAEVPVTKQLIDMANAYHTTCVGVQQVTSEEIEKYCTMQVNQIADRCYDVARLIEKPKRDEILSNYAILGRYVLTSDIFDLLESAKPGYGGEIQLTDAIHAMCGQRRVLAYEFEGRRYDIGSLRGYLETIIDFALLHPESGDWLKRFIQDKAKNYV
jgi:UTP--glucose-1-phosphate uridylyltransferase